MSKSYGKMATSNSTHVKSDDSDNLGYLTKNKDTKFSSKRKSHNSQNKNKLKRNDYRWQ